MDQLYERYKRALKSVELPCAFIDLDFLENNVINAILRAKDKKIRIATKSIRSRYLLRKILDTKPEAFNGLMAYSAAESVWLTDGGFDNVLVAYPTVQSQHVKKVCQQIKKGKQIVLMADCIEHLDHLDQLAREEGCQLPLCLDIDMITQHWGVHFGVFRSPIDSVKKLEEVLRHLKGKKNLKLMALMGYEAQVAGVGDRNPFQKVMSVAISLLQKISRNRYTSRRQECVALCHSMGFSLEWVNGGGTGSMEWTREDSSVTEIAVGSGFYSPLLFDYYSRFKHQPAAGFAIEIVRQPRHEIYTCLGGGYVASGALNLDKIPRPHLPPGCELLPHEMAGEVQTPIKYKGKLSLNLGDPIFMRHAKAGELCERFSRLWLIRGGQIDGECSTYRGEGQCFL